MIKNREALAEYFNDQGFKVGAEVGVFRGYFSEILCKSIPGLKLYCVDPWKIYDGYRDYRFERSMRDAETTARRELAKYDTVIIKKTSVEAAKDFEDGSLDFVYIDGNHEYKYVKEDLEAWVPKVRKGGIVAGDDYYMTKRGNMGVIEAVHEYVGAHGYDLQLTPWDPKHPNNDNRQPQWWFVK